MERNFNREALSELYRNNPGERVSLTSIKELVLNQPTINQHIINKINKPTINHPTINLANMQPARNRPSYREETFAPTAYQEASFLPASLNVAFPIVAYPTIPYSMASYPPASCPKALYPTTLYPTASRPTESRITQSRRTELCPTESRPVQSRPTDSHPTGSYQHATQNSENTLEDEEINPRINLGIWRNSIQDFGVLWIAELSREPITIDQGDRGEDMVRFILEETDRIEANLEKIRNLEGNRNSSTSCIKLIDGTQQQIYPYWNSKDFVARSLQHVKYNNVNLEQNSITKHIKSIIERQSKSKIEESKSKIEESKSKIEESKSIIEIQRKENHKENNTVKNLKQTKERSRSRSNIEFLKTMNLEDYPVLCNVDNSVLENLKATIERTKMNFDSQPRKLYKITPDLISKLNMKSSIIRSKSQMNSNLKPKEKK